MTEYAIRSFGGSNESIWLQVAQLGGGSLKRPTRIWSGLRNTWAAWTVLHDALGVEPTPAECASFYWAYMAPLQGWEFVILTRDEVACWYRTQPGRGRCYIREWL